MGAAACKNSKSTEQKSDNKDNKIITIGVFGLDDAGKTTTVKAIEGNPTADVEPTQGSATSTIDNPNKGGKSDSVKLIDVCGSKKYRDKLWPPFYKQIHGLIYVFDASEKKRFRENEEVLETLLDHADLKGKPILIFANKQDDRDALKHEDTIRKKLSIEELKTKHKIELCTAVPTSKKSSTDPSIREGISWLIKTIEADYNTLNARVNPSSTNAPQTPKQRGKTNRSNSDSDELYPKRRQDSPLGQKNKLAPLDLSRKKTTPRNGHDTYDENDDDSTFTRQRPKISEFDSRRSASPPLTTSNDFHKKKTTAGNTFGLRGHTNDTNTKPFRTSFETLPEEAPWSIHSSRSTKTDNNFLKPTTTNPWSSDASKRDRSPSFRESKVPPLALPSKRGNLSDDDDISYGPTSKQKSPMNSNNRLKDPYDDTRLTSSSRPFSAAKKPSSGIYGADDDDDDDKYGKKDFKKPGITTGSKLGKDPDFDDDIGKRMSRPWDRTSGLDDYRGSPAKGGALPSSSTFGAGRSKSGGDPYSSSLTKPDSKWKSSTDDLPPLSSKSFGRSASPVKPSIGSKLNDDDDDDTFPPSHKATARSRSPGDPYGSSWKPSSTSKYASQSDSSAPYKSSAPFKSTADDRPLTGSKFGSRSKLTDDYPPISSPNPLRSRFGDINRAVSPSKPSLTSKFNDDEKDSYRNPSTRANSQLKPIDDLPSKSTKTFSYGDDDDKYDTPFKRGGTRPNFGNKDSSSSLSKGKSTNKYGDDDDDDDKYGPSSKFSTKSKMTSKFSDDDDDKYGSSSKSTTKPKTTSKFSDDDDDKYKSPSKAISKPKTSSKYSDDDDDKYGSLSKSTTKPKTTSKYSDDDDKYSSPSKSVTKPKTTSKFSDDDDDKYGPSSKFSTKSKITSKFSDDDDDDKYGSSSKSTTKPKTTSKFSDDDDDKYKSPSKAISKPKTSSKYSDDDDKYSSPSKTTSKPKTTSKYSDDDDDKYGSSLKSTSKPKTTSKYSDDDDDKYSSPSKSTSKPKTASKYSDDDDDKYGSPSKSTSKPKTTSKYSDDDDDKYGSSSKSTSYPSKPNSSTRFGGYSGSGGIGSRYD